MAISSRTTYVCVAISSRTAYDDRRRYHLELHMMMAVDMTLYCLRMHVDYARNCYLVLPSFQITRRGLN